MRRYTIVLDDERYERLRERAEDSGESVATLIHNAIDRLLDDDLERRRQAAGSLLAAEPMPVADWPEMEREIETTYERSLWDHEPDA